jgi:hypothetical protein
MIKSQKKSIAMKQLLLLLLIYHSVCKLKKKLIKITPFKINWSLDSTTSTTESKFEDVD